MAPLSPGMNVVALTPELLEQMRAKLAPLFEEQRAEWEREGPTALEQLATIGAELDVIGGNCPVQASGAVDGKRFYFRARGDSWQFHVAADDDQLFVAPDFYREAPYGDWPATGWMPQHEAIGFIVESIEAYRAAASAGVD